ncbi:MAG: hypothetical protein H8E86_05125 [Planctomycetes bacterium]|nr:hypothetical protein [Planctomycetota bacterium]
MLRLLPILLLILQTLQFAVPVHAASENVQASQKMSCCGGCCKCAANGCACEQKREETPAPAKTPFTIFSIDFAPPAATAAVSLPAKVANGEISLTAKTLRIACTNNCRQALLGRWQN